MKSLLHQLQLSALAVTLTLAACSEEPPPSQPSAPLVERSAADAVQPEAEELRSSFAPGGVEATYRATFRNGQIQHLLETRKATSQSGTYEFRGARLMKYRGAALGASEVIELEFDAQGKVLLARAGDKEVSAEEISAIRDRAQSLRSHALAQHDLRSHDRN